MTSAGEPERETAECVEAVQVLLAEVHVGGGKVVAELFFGAGRDQRDDRPGCDTFAGFSGALEAAAPRKRPLARVCTPWPMRLTCWSLPGARWPKGRLTGKYLTGQPAGPATEAGRP
jgi:hypothetical protein